MAIMEIIAHRGFWNSDIEKNTEVAFQRAIDFGFGIETDVRDSNGKLVISHDSPSGGEMTFESFMFKYGSRVRNLAINVKSDGLSHKFETIFTNNQTINVVFFDMSGPEQLQYRKRGLKTLNRVSEFEPGYKFDIPDYGTWLDGFDGDDWRISWLGSNRRKPNVFVVSPELHGRPHKDFWEKIKQFPSDEYRALCTDFPMQAKVFFEVSND